MSVQPRSYFTLSFLQYDWRISCLKFGTDQTMMMCLAIPSEREKVSFSLREDWDIDDRKLSICQLREGVLSEWPNVYLETFKVDSIVYFILSSPLSTFMHCFCDAGVLHSIVSSKGFERKAGLLTDKQQKLTCLVRKFSNACLF